MALLADRRGVMSPDRSSSGGRVIYEIDRKLAQLGWSPVEGIVPSGWQPDLMATDGRGTLLCIEVRVGSEPLHSGVLSTLTQAQSDLSSTWPGRSVVALLATNPISERLQAAFASSGIVLLRLRDLDDFDRVVSELVRILNADIAEELPASEVTASLMNQAAFALDAGRLEDARRLYDDVLRNQVKILGETHPSVVETKHRLATLL